MAENTNFINVGGRLHSIATGNVLAGANEILDDTTNKTQVQINEEVNTTLETYGSIIEGLNSQNYVSVESYSELPELGSINTIYRVSSWDGEQVDTTKYAEYAWRNTGVDQGEYILLDVKNYGIDDKPIAGSDNLVKSGGVFNELTLGAVYDVSAKNPTAGHNNDGKFESLSALLSNTNLNTLIPIAYRKGGMSIRFVQSSDNKYVQYRLMAEDFTTDVTQWAVCDIGVYVDNPEFIRLYTDSDGKILWAIKADGDIYFGVGVPEQVKAYIKSKISELSLDEYENIVTFLDDLINGDKTLQQLLDEKVDKITGKSLINSEYASRISYIENPEWITIVTDQNDNILYGIRTNGDFYFGSGCPPQIEAYVLAHKQEITEELSTKVDKVSGKSLIDSEYSSNVSTINSIEWHNIVTDTYGKIIEGVNSYQKQYFCNVFSSGSMSAKEGIFNGLNIKALDFQESSLMEVNEIEWSMLLLDGNNNILFGIKKDGSTFPVSTTQLTAIKEYIDNLETYTKHFEIPFDALKKEVIELPEYGNVIVTQYSYILEEIQVNGVAYFHFSTDLGATWTTSENTIGDITHVHIFLDGTILVCGRRKAYTTKDFITFTESTIYDIDGSVLSQLPRDGFYSSMHHDTCNIINGVEIEIWGEYILDRGEHPCVWYTMDKGATIRCAFKADTTEVDGVVTTCRHIHKVSYCEKNNRFYITTGDTPSTSPTLEEIHFISGTLNNGVWAWTELGSGSSFKFGIPFFDDNFMYLITDYTSASQNEQKGIIYVPISDIENINNDIDMFRYAHRCKVNDWVTIDDLPMAPVDIAMDGNGNKLFFGDYRTYGYLWVARKGFEFERVKLSKKCIFMNIMGPNFNGDLFAQCFDGTVPYIPENFKLNRGRSINLTEMMRNNRVDDFMKQLNYIYKF